MTRVSLKEAYDNKDVVAQIYAIRDIAEGAEDNANSALSTANTSSEHVDALVPQVEGAVQNANNASASAQASAQTVAGYENRLSTVESDLNAVTLRVTTAEGQIVTIQGRVTALETADGQNIKIDQINNYAVGLTGNQTKAGELTLTSSLILKAYQAETIQAANGPRIGVNPSASQVIMRLYQNASDADYVARDTVYQGADTKTLSRLWYLQRQNESGTGVDSISLSLTFDAQTGRATLLLTDSQGTRAIL